MTQLECYDCRFFVVHDENAPGHCRRNPPTVGRFRGEDEDPKYDYGQWPNVSSFDWCGAFEPDQETPPKGTAQTDPG